MEAGRGDEAEPLLKQAVEATARVYGADSQAHLQARRTHADALSLAGRTAEAERAFESLLAEMEKRYGPNSPQSTIAMNNLALLRAEHGRANEVEPMLRAALASASQPGSGVDPKWLRRNLGYCLTKLGRFDEAQAELLAAFEQFKSDPNPRANDRTVSRLVELYSAWGKSSEAQRWRATTQPATLPADPVSTGR
jgi:tetratricopeptide (TPR) repeat protein